MEKHMAHIYLIYPDMCCATDLRNVWLHVKECVNTQPQVGQVFSRLGITHDEAKEREESTKTHGGQNQFQSVPFFEFTIR